MTVIYIYTEQDKNEINALWRQLNVKCHRNLIYYSRGNVYIYILNHSLFPLFYNQTTSKITLEQSSCDWNFCKRWRNIYSWHKNKLVGICVYLCFQVFYEKISYDKDDWHLAFFATSQSILFWQNPIFIKKNFEAWTTLFFINVKTY